MLAAGTDAAEPATLYVWPVGAAGSAAWQRLRCAAPLRSRQGRR